MQPDVTVDEIMLLFEEAVSHNASFAALRAELDKSKPLAQYMRLLAADQGKVDAEAAKALSLTVPELKGLQVEAMRALRVAVAALG